MAVSCKITMNDCYSITHIMFKTTHIYYTQYKISSFSFLSIQTHMSLQEKGPYFSGISCSTIIVTFLSLPYIIIIDNILQESQHTKYLFKTLYYIITVLKY